MIGETVQDEGTDPETAEEEAIKAGEADTTAARRAEADTIAARKAGEADTTAARKARDRAKVNVLHIHQEKEEPADANTKKSKAPQGA